MEHAFWHDRWAKGRIGFHQVEVNEYLERYWGSLDIPAQAEVLVPLCGKSLDMLWLREQKCSVLGVELSERACRDFYAEQEVQPEEASNGRFLCLNRDGVALWCGDFFDLERGDVENIQGVFDRAALIALPPVMRERYAQHLCEILPAKTQILLVTLEFEGDQGPPFSVPESEVVELFAGRFQVACLGRTQLTSDRDRGRTEAVYKLVDIRSGA